MPDQEARLVMIDGRTALGAILVLPHPTALERVVFEAHCRGIAKIHMIGILREVVRLWEIELAAPSEGPAHD